MVPAINRGHFATFRLQTTKLMAKNVNPNADFYQMERFSADQLRQMQRSFYAYSLMIGGTTKNHSEAITKRGWLTPFLLAYDDLLWGRWNYWLDLSEKGTIEGSVPIPQIAWANGPGVDHTRKMLEKCMDHPESNIEKFADWLLWGLSGTKEAPNISASLNQHYYEKFDLFLVLNYPTDYLSYLLSEATGRGYKEALGYYPTPMHLTILMNEISFGGVDPEVAKRQTVNDPCVGCGAMLLPASNHVLRAHAMDISSIAVKLCHIQMIWYAPWFAMPKDLKGFDESVIADQEMTENSEEQQSEREPVFVGSEVTAEDQAFSESSLDTTPNVESAPCLIDVIAPQIKVVKSDSKKAMDAQLMFTFD